MMPRLYFFISSSGDLGNCRPIDTRHGGRRSLSTFPPVLAFSSSRHACVLNLKFSSSTLEVGAIFFFELFRVQRFELASVCVAPRRSHRSIVPAPVSDFGLETANLEP